MATDQQAKKSTDLEIRWLTRDHLPAVIDIEEMSFDHPWQAFDFVRHYRRHNVVAEMGGQLVGYMITACTPSQVAIVNLAVHPAWRRRGVARRIVGSRITYELHRAKNCGVAPRPIMAHVRETNLPAQLLMRACGLRCIGIDPSPYDDVDEDAYWFAWSGSGGRDKALVPLR